MARNAPWIVGLATFPIVGLLFFALVEGVIAAALVGALAAAALGGGVAYAFPTDPELEAYRADARRRVGKVLGSVRAIERMSTDVADPVARDALQRGAARVPELLASVQEHDPRGVASMAATLNVTTSGIASTLGQYLEIQRDPDLFTDAPALLRTGQEGFVGFDQFVADTYRRLNDAEVVGYKATLAALRPFQIRELT